MLRGAIIRGKINYYQCCKCQKLHYEDDPLFEKHIRFQSKHGIMEDMLKGEPDKTTQKKRGGRGR